MDNSLKDLSDRRNFPRIDATVLVRHLFYYYAKPQTPPGESDAYTKNIGGGGIMFETDVFAPSDAFAELEIHLPNLSIPIQTIAKIVWVQDIKHNETEKKYRMGASFLEIGEDDRNTLIDFIQSNTPKKDRT